MLLTVVFTLLVTVSGTEFATNNWYIKLKKPTSLEDVRDLVRRSGFSVVNKVSV